MAVNASLRLFNLFHLNLAYSSIGLERRRDVICQCYWPLLRLIEEEQYPAGIEVTGYTLECVHALDPAWIEKLKALIERGLVELIGSGRAQIIGPLVPPRINQENLRLGHQTYERLLGVRPTIGLVNEQAYSSGLISLYLDAGYEAIIVDWDNPFSQHGDWDEEWGYFPQYAVGPSGERIAVLWNHSIRFQKFQRYVHGDTCLSDFVHVLAQHVSAGNRSLPLYSNDVEVFDFRPGRFHTEPPEQAESEWQRIHLLVRHLANDSRFVWVLPTEVLGFQGEASAGKELKLESLDFVIPVKKQSKYNVSRWAISGRSDLWINTVCHRLHQAYLACGETSDASWIRLCELWASDFRTHIHEERWRLAVEEARTLLDQYGVEDPALPKEESIRASQGASPCVTLDRERNLLTIQTEHVRCILSVRRGLTIQSLSFLSHDFDPLVGTVPHGHFKDIALGADYYTGLVVIELPMEHRRVTDLNPVTPSVVEEDDAIVVSTVQETSNGPIHKSVRVEKFRPEARIAFDLSRFSLQKGVVRLGHVTLLSENLSKDLIVRTHNGGHAMETVSLSGVCDHTLPASTLVSCRSGLGSTEGRIELGDGERGVVLSWNPADCAAFPMLVHRESVPSSLTRVVFSLSELDQTCRNDTVLLPFSLSIRPRD